MVKKKQTTVKKFSEIFERSCFNFIFDSKMFLRILKTFMYVFLASRKYWRVVLELLSPARPDLNLIERAWN
jgi:hypothetical protein